MCICLVRVDEWYTPLSSEFLSPFLSKNNCLIDIPYVTVTWRNVLLLSFYAQKVLLRSSEHYLSIFCKILLLSLSTCNGVKISGDVNAVYWKTVTYTKMQYLTSGVLIDQPR